MKKFLALVSATIICTCASAQQPFKTEVKRKEIRQYYKENFCGVSPGSTIIVITPKPKGYKDKDFDGVGGIGLGDGEYSERNPYARPKTPPTKQNSSTEVEDTDDTEETEEAIGITPVTPPSETPSSEKVVRRSKMTYTTEEDEVGNEIPRMDIQPVLVKPKRTVTKPTPPQAPPVILDCAQRMQLTKFYTDSSLTEFKLVGLEVRTGEKADTFIVSDKIKGATSEMNITSLARIYSKKGSTANNGAKPTPFTEALFASGAQTVQLSRYMIVIAKTKNYDLCKTREVIETMTWSSIKRAPNGKGSH